MNGKSVCRGFVRQVENIEPNQLISYHSWEFKWPVQQAVIRDIVAGSGIVIWRTTFC